MKAKAKQDIHDLQQRIGQIGEELLLALVQEMSKKGNLKESVDAMNGKQAIGRVKLTYLVTGDPTWPNPIHQTIRNHIQFKSTRRSIRSIISKKNIMFGFGLFRLPTWLNLNDKCGLDFGTWWIDLNLNLNMLDTSISIESRSRWRNLPPRRSFWSRARCARIGAQWENKTDSMAISPCFVQWCLQFAGESVPLYLSMNAQGFFRTTSWKKLWKEAQITISFWTHPIMAPQFVAVDHMMLWSNQVGISSLVVTMPWQILLDCWTNAPLMLEFGFKHHKRRQLFLLAFSVFTVNFNGMFCFTNLKTWRLKTWHWIDIDSLYLWQLW